MEARITRPARKHRLSSNRIRAALATAAFVEMDGDMAIYVGTDDRDLETELGVVADDRGEGSPWCMRCREDGGSDDRQATPEGVS